MLQKLLILTIWISATTIVSGQSSTSQVKPIHQFGIDLGGAHHQVRDNIIAPLRYDGIGLHGSFSYLVSNAEWQHHLHLKVRYASLSNRFDHVNRVAEINLGYSHMRKIMGEESIGPLYFGGRINWSYNLQYYDNWDDSHFYWLNAYELGPSIQWNHPVGDHHHLALALNIPVIALVSRPPLYRYYDQLKLDKIYSETHENMKVTSLHDYISIGLRGQYINQVSRKFSVGVSYFLNYKTYSKPERITLLTNNLQMRLLFTLGNIQN